MRRETKRLPEKPIFTTNPPSQEEIVSEAVLPTALTPPHSEGFSAQRSAQALARIPGQRARQQAFSALQSSYGNQFVNSVARSFQPPSPSSAALHSTRRDDSHVYTFENGQSLFLKPGLLDQPQLAPARDSTPNSSAISPAQSKVQRTLTVISQSSRSNVAKAINKLINEFNGKNGALRSLIAKGVTEEYIDRESRVPEQLDILDRIMGLAKGKKWDERRSLEMTELLREIAKEREYLVSLLDEGGALAEPEAKDYSGGGDGEAEYKAKSSGLDKEFKHGVSSAMEFASLHMLSQPYRPISGRSEMQSLTASVAPEVEVKGRHGGVRKAAGGAGKLLAENFIEAGYSAKKASALGAIKKELSAEQSELPAEDYADLMLMLNSLRGAFKRQTAWELTAGTVKQGISLGVSALTGAPGAGQLLTASVSQVAGYAAASAGGAAVGAGAEKATASRGMEFKQAGAKKLDVDGWSDLLVKFLNHENERIQFYVEDIILCLFSQKGKGEELLRIARATPGEAAKLIYARQQGAKQYKEAVRAYRKAYKKDAPKNWLIDDE